MIRMLIMTMVIIASCNSAKQKRNSDMAFEIIKQHAVGGMISKDFVVVKERGEFTELFKGIYKEQNGNAQIPEINFNDYMVIALFMGEKTTGGYKITVVGVEETNKNVVVTYKETQPGPNDMVTMALTQPYCIIKIPRTTKSIVFQEATK